MSENKTPVQKRQAPAEFVSARKAGKAKGQSKSAFIVSTYRSKKAEYEAAGILKHLQGDIVRTFEATEEACANQFQMVNNVVRKHGLR